MSKQANPTVIGAFVVAAIGLLAIAAMLFGGKELLAPETQFVSYFDGSVKGLRKGANVLFRGVRVGFVEEIQLQGDANTLETQVQVLMRVFPDQFRLTHRGQLIDSSATELDIDNLIEAGVKAQLGVESYVTGQLLVELDFHPDQPTVFRGENPPVPEIPTIANNIQQMVERVRKFVTDLQSQVDIEQLAINLQSTMKGIDELVNSVDLRESLAGFNKLINAEDTQQLTASLEATLEDAQLALQDVRTLIGNADTSLESVVASLQPIIKRLDSTLMAAQATLEDAGEQLQGDTELSYRLVGTLAEIERTARSLRIFLDYIETNPESLLRGKPRE